MIALVGLLTIIVLGKTVVRVGGTMLELTGLSNEVAFFQAQSAFSGAGFTTSESESIVSHPLRRKIVRTLILLGNAGITTTIATFILTFVGQSSEDIAKRALILLISLCIISIVSRSQFVYKTLKKIVIKAFENSKALALYDYQEVLGIHKGYSIMRLKVKDDNWMVGRHLKDLSLHKEGTLVLSIHRFDSGKEKFIIPSGETVIARGDELTIYGKDVNTQCLFKRTKENGENAHKERIKIEESRKKLQATEV